MWNVIDFLQSNKIHYVTSGPNTASGEVSIRCPFCGSADKSQHMGINLKTGYWACWRDSSHRGKSPVFLIRELIGCSTQEARELAGLKTDISSEDFLGRLDSILFPEGLDVDKKVSRKLELPDNFYKVTPNGSSKLYWNYLINRKFRSKDISKLVSLYNLKYCAQGNWAGRIIIPIYQDGKLVNWTGRSVSKRAYLRYKTLTTDEDKSKKQNDPVALKSIKQCLFNYDELMNGGDILYIVEGPFDALKLDFYLRDKNKRATCLFGLATNEEQFNLILSLKRKFNKIVLMLDSKEILNTFKLQNKYGNCIDSVFMLPEKFDDPGEMSFSDISKLL